MTFDIDARMGQWDAAGRSQHVEDTETILRGGNPYVEEKRGREDFKDPENVFQFMEWMFGPFDYGDDEGYLRLKSALKNNPELARSLMAALEQTTLQNGDYRRRGGYGMVPGEFQDPERGMNRIGANKPRQEFWEEFSYAYPEPDGEGGYYTAEATADDDVTEEKPGPTDRAKAAANEAKETKDNEKSKGDTEKTESTKKSFDIDTRMQQWDSANKAQHTEEIERSLRDKVRKFIDESKAVAHELDPSPAAENWRRKKNAVDVLNHIADLGEGDFEGE